MPVEIDSRRPLDTAEMKVGEHPVAEKSATVELLIEFVPYDAVSSISADEP